MKILLSLPKRASPHTLGFLLALCVYLSLAFYLFHTPRAKQISMEGNHRFTLSLQNLEPMPKQPSQNKLMPPKQTSQPKQPTSPKKVAKPKQIAQPKTQKELPQPTPLPPQNKSQELSPALSPLPATSQAPILGENTQESKAKSEGISHHFLSTIHSLIASHNPYPQRARRQRLEGEVVIEFILEISGELTEVKIISTNAKEILQKSALKALYQASKHFPLPSKRLKIQVPILYKLQ